MNKVIEQIYSSGCVEDAQGNIYRHDASPVTFETGALLYNFVRAMNYPAASCGVSEGVDKSFPEGVTPECFYRGSSPELAWIPA